MSFLQSLGPIQIALIVAGTIFVIIFTRWDRERKINESVEFIKTLVLAAILALIIRSTVVEAYKIPSTSMVPTLEVGDRLLVNKFIYFFKKPQRFEVVVFKPPPEVSNDKIFIKRIVGLPGDVVAVRENKLFVNGQAIDEDYINEPIFYQLPAKEIPPEMVFVMGDNRNRSHDSHVWGTLPMENLLGRAILRYYPIPKISLLK